MKIYYNRKQQRLMLIISVLFIIIGTASAIYSSSGMLTGFVGVGVMYLSIYIYRNITQYAEIKDGYIKKNSVPAKKIYESDITSVRKFAGDYIIKSGKHELTIDTNHVDKKSLASLEQFIARITHSLPAV